MFLLKTIAAEMRVNMKKKIRNILLLICVSIASFIYYDNLTVLYNDNKILFIIFILSFIALYKSILDYILRLQMTSKNSEQIDYIPKDNRNRLIRFLNFLLMLYLTFIMDVALKYFS